MKDKGRLDGPWEFGIKPVEHNKKADWEEVFKNAEEGKFEKIPADIKVKHYHNLLKI